MKKRVFLLSVFVAMLLFFGCDLFHVYHTTQYKPEYAIGINCGLPDDSTLTLMEQTGVLWIRMHMSWQEVEPERGVRDWTLIDERVDAAYARDFRIYMSIWETPEWASESGEANAVPADPAYFREFMEACVERYKDRIQFWGIWNAPNCEEYFTGTSAEFRDNIFIPGGLGVRAADRDAYIVGPGLNVQPGWDDWMQDILTEEATGLLNIVAIQLYLNGDVEELFEYIYSYSSGSDEVASVSGVLEGMNLDDLDLWLNETGWSVSGPGAVSEETQAQYIADLCWHVYGCTIPYKTFIQGMIDAPAIPEDGPRFGLLRSDYVPRESYYRVQEFLGSQLMIE